MSIKVSGGSGIIRNINNYGKQVERDMTGNLRKACLLVRRRSQLEVPVDTGNLKATAFTMVVKIGSILLGIIGYAAAYAGFVHERLELRHNPGKKAKFLEDPLKASESEIKEILAGG